MSLITPDSYFLDVGANIGWFSLLVADFIQKESGCGKVYAVEANPNIIPYFMASVVDSGFGSIVSIKPYAVSDGYGLIEMDTSVAGNVGGLKIRSLTKGGTETGRNIIPKIVLDDIFEDIPRLDLMKIDIEGAEPLALDGMTRLLNKFSPNIIMEINGDGLKSVSAKSVAQLVAQMDEYGYKPYDIRKDGLSGRSISSDEVCNIVEKKSYYDFLFQR